MRIDAKVEGINEMMAVLKGLRPAVQRRVLRPALAIEGRNVARAAKALVPVRLGQLKKAQGSKLKTYENGTVIAIVGAQRKKYVTYIGGKKIDPSKYDHLVHGGTQPHFIAARTIVRTKVTLPGQFHPGTKPFPYLKIASANTMAGAGQRISARMSQEIKKLAVGNKLKL